MSVLIKEAFAEWRECRAEYEAVLYAQYLRAEEATRGALVNAEGRARGIEPMSLFMGTAARAYRWASEELKEHWARDPRLPYVEYERQWAASREERYA